MNILISSYGRFHVCQSVNALAPHVKSVKALVSDKTFFLKGGESGFIFPRGLGALQLTSYLLKRFLRVSFADSFFFRLHDLFVGLYILVNKHNIDIFIGYSLYCKFSLKVAKKYGIYTCVERAGSHPSYQKKIIFDEYARLHLNVPLPLKSYLKSESRMASELSFCDSVITCSEYAKDTLTRNGVSSGKIIVEYLGANFLPESGLEARVPQKILFVGTEPIIKGAVYFLDVLRNLIKESAQFSAVIVSNLSDTIIKEYEDVLSFAAVEWKRSCNWKELSGLYRSSDFLVCTSIDDAFNMVVMESIHFKTPVILFDSVGASEVVSKTGSGVSIPMGDHEALLKTINRMLTDEHFLSGLRQRCGSVTQQLSWERYGRSLVNKIEGKIKK